LKLPWPAVARADFRAQRKLQTWLLRKQLREETGAFSRHYRTLLAAHGTARSVRTLDDLTRLPRLARSQLAGTQAPEARANFELLPEAGSIRAHWPFGRKLALVIGGKRAGRVLRRSYTPVTSVSVAPELVARGAVSLTEYDLDLLAEGTLRGLEVAGVDLAADRIATHFSSASEFARLAYHVTAERGGLRLAADAEPASVLVCDAASAATLTLDVPPPHLIVCVTEHIDAPLRNELGERLERAGTRLVFAWAQPLLRSIWYECAAQHGVHTSADHALLEWDAENGELLFTDLVGHGTSFVRVASGARLARAPELTPCPGCGRTLPRLLGDLGPLD